MGSGHRGYRVKIRCMVGVLHIIPARAAKVKKRSTGGVPPVMKKRRPRAADGLVMGIILVAKVIRIVPDSPGEGSEP